MQLAFTTLAPTGKKYILSTYYYIISICVHLEIFLHTLTFFCSSRTLRDDRELHIHPNSVLYGEKPPKWLVYFYLYSVSSLPDTETFPSV